MSYGVIGVKVSMLNGLRAVLVNGIPHKPTIRWLVGLALVFVAHVWLLAPVLQNGDAAVYAEQIEHNDLSIRTTHVGYMLVGIVANRLLPFVTELNLNIMCLLFASAGAVAAGATCRRLGGSREAAFFTPLLVMGLQPYLRGGVLAEVDGVAAALILLSVVAWLSEMRAAAGVAFGYSMLVTPLTVLSLPVFLLSYIGTKKGWSAASSHVSNVVVFGTAALAIYSPFVFCYWHDYWEGGRGLLHAPREAWDVGEQIRRSLRFFEATAIPWIGLALAGAVFGITRFRSIALGTLIATALAAVVGERFGDVPVQLPQLCLFAILAVLVLDQIGSKALKSLAFTTIWLIAVLPNYVSEHDEVVNKVQLTMTYRAMADQTPKLMVIGLGDSWIDGLPFERQIYHRTKLGLGLDFRQFAGSSRSIARDRLDYALWLMTAPPPGLMSPFTQHWKREIRSVLGRSYEVWLPQN